MDGGESSSAPMDDWTMEEYSEIPSMSANNSLAGPSILQSSVDTGSSPTNAAAGTAAAVTNGGTVQSNGSNNNTLSGNAAMAAALGELRKPSMTASIFNTQPASKPGSKAGSGDGVSSRAKEREELNSGVLMFRNPLSIAVVVVRGSEFHIHADLLCKHSDYFRGCLRGLFAEAQTQRIELDDEDLSVEDFGLWVDLLYRAHFHEPHGFLLRKEETGGTLSTKQILTMWRLSDRFLHQPLAKLVEESLEHRLSLYSADQWRKLYRTRPASDLRARVSRLQDAYRQCVDQGLPFADRVVEACANCPPQVYAESVDLLEADFMAPVSRRMILSHADSALLSKDQRLSSSSTSLGVVRDALLEERLRQRDHR